MPDHVSSHLPQALPPSIACLNHLGEYNEERCSDSRWNWGVFPVHLSFLVLAWVTSAWVVLSHHWCCSESEGEGNNNMIFMFYKWSSEIPLSLRTAGERQSAVYRAEWKAPFFRRSHMCIKKPLTLGVGTCHDFSVTYGTCSSLFHC